MSSSYLFGVPDDEWRWPLQHKHSMELDCRRIQGQELGFPVTLTPVVSISHVEPQGAMGVTAMVISMLTQYISQFVSPPLFQVQRCQNALDRSTLELNFQWLKFGAHFEFYWMSVTLCCSDIYLTPVTFVGPVIIATLCYQECYAIYLLMCRLSSR